MSSLGTRPASNSPSCHRRSRSLANGFLPNANKPSGNCHLGDVVEGDFEKLNESFVRRRHKSVADFSSSSQEMLMQEYISGGACLAITGKGLALRSNAAIKSFILTDAEASGENAGQMNMQDSFVADGFPVVKKSSSTSSLIFDGLPIPQHLQMFCAPVI